MKPLHYDGLGYCFHMASTWVGYLIILWRIYTQ